jgi:hypothetical protein
MRLNEQESAGWSLKIYRWALMHAKDCHAESEDRWLVEGDDMDGDSLKAVVVLEDGVIVVTVF